MLMKTPKKTFFHLFFRLNPEESRLRFQLKNQKNISHHYDVSNFRFNEASQKIFAHHHCTLCEENLNLTKNAVNYDEILKVFYDDYSRILWEDQKISSKSKFFRAPPFRKLLL